MSFNKTLGAVLIAGSAQLAAMETAGADAATGPYVGLDGGLAWTSNITYQTTYNGCSPPYYCGYPQYYNAVTFNLGYSAGVQLGYAFGGPRLEFEYNYRNNAANTIATTAGTQSATGSLTSTNYMANLLYDFDTGSQWVPYVGLGLGAANVKANSIRPSSSSGVSSGFLDGSSTKFAAQFILGAEFQASDTLGLFFDWRGLWANNTNYTYGIGCPSGGTSGCLQTGTTSWTYWNGALNVGVHVHF